MLNIDGSRGEGGGQVLRTSLACSLLTQQPFTLEKIRANRSKPGLMRQHLTCVHAAATIGGARVRGDSLRSSRVVFEPGPVTPGDYHFAVGTAGSLHLVLQTVLLPLALADGPSTLILEGGTHNPKAPPFEFLERSYVPVLRRMGVQIELLREQSGFYPAGGGRVRVEITPGSLSPLTLTERGEVGRIRATAIVSNLPRSIANRELRVLRERLKLPRSAVRVREDESPGPGNAVFIEVSTEALTAVFFGFGAKGTSAEQVADRLADRVIHWLELGVPVEEYLQDQLLLPLCLAAGGTIRTVSASSHTTTNLEVLSTFTGVRYAVKPRAAGICEVSLTTG